MDSAVTRAPSQTAFLAEVKQVSEKLSLGEGGGIALVVIVTEFGDGVQIGLLSGFGQTANDHVLGHFGA